jgi:hypothetical protein
MALAGVIVRRPRETLACFAGAAAVMTIFINALFFQHGPHPAPIFAAPAVVKTTLVAPAPTPMPAARIVESAPLRQIAMQPARPSAPEPVARPQPAAGPAKATPAKDTVRADAIAELIAPPRRLAGVQRALSDYGYGQIKDSGQMGPDTEQAIAKFERDHKMPVTGQMSDRLVRALAAMTGRALD